MLYVFHVETGTMMTFDMNLAMEKVSSLQNVIAKGCRIPEDKQVLLISGGESLDHDTVVGKYHAGTDTNPIFLFSKSTIESSIPPSPSVNYGSDTDLQDPVEGSLLMPPAYETVVSRAQLALQFQDVDTEELRACEHLILDQHLQQQGWAAVVANLEDVTSELKQRSETFHETYQQYLENRQEYKELISSVSESLSLLSKIPVLPSLISSRDLIQDDMSTVGDINSSLYDWIESQDPNHTLHDMVEQCGKSTEQLDEKVDVTLCSEVDQLMKEVQNDSMKEVKGLEDRLYGLDQIISGAKKIVQEQAELAQGFVQNQNRLSNLRDRSILPDLCSSHRNQLIEMMKNHSRLREIKKKCRMAKEELSVNLHTRLRWVMYVEKKICDVDGKLTIYLGNLRRLRKRVDILQQVQDAPKVYAQLVIEVVRRKQFSSKYLVWANSLAEDSGQLHEDEVKRRDSFLRLIGHHFLQPMFHGLEDYPPAFATEAPDIFDHNLPEVTADDIKQLRDAVPELSHILSDPAKDEFVIAPRCVPPDSSVKWEDSGELGLKVPHAHRRLPGCKSDSEAIHVDQSPYSIEGGSMSLGDQFEECKVEVDSLVHKPGFDCASPPDTEFLLPKSLSEELTLEMKETEQVIKSHAAVEDVKAKENVTVASTSQASKAGPSSRKSLTDTSPDLEGSQEFTTADFYFDESMPSSIESPPKTCSEKSNLEQCVLAEKQLNVKLQQQMKEYAKKLSQSEKTLKMLKQFFDTKLPSLTDTAKELKKEHLDHVQTVINEFENIRENVKQHVQSYETEVAEKTRNEIEKLHLEKKEVKQLLDEQNQKSSELEKSVSELNKEIDEKDKKHKLDLDEVREKFESEMKELKLKHELELEVELDKVKAEFDDKVSDLEKEIDCKNKVIGDKESAIKKLEVDIIKIEENLNDKFQTEKEQICDILGIEYDQKLEKEVVKKVEEMKQSVVADLMEKHDKERSEQLDALKQCLIAEKQEAVEMTQSTLTIEHTKGLEDTKKKLMDERIEELEKQKSELNSKFQEDMAKLSFEFNKEKEGLVKELELLKNKPTAVIEVQTVNSIFDKCDMESQSDPQPKQIDTQAQTDLSNQQTSSMQTDCQDQSHLGIQTESVLTKSSTNQTETTDTTDSSVQPESILGVEISVQTDTSDCGSDKKHCEESVSETVDTVTDNSETNKVVHSPETDVEEIRKALLAEYEEKISLLEKKHEDEISQLIAQIEKEKEDALQLKSSLTSLTGNQQTKFNEAVNRVSREKDSKIEELKIKEMKLNEEIKGLKEQVEVLRKEKSKVEDVKERALSFLKDKEAVLHQMEVELEEARSRCKLDQDKVEGAEATGVDVEQTTPSASDIVSAEEPSLQQKIKELETMVKSKEEEISKMTQKVMELSMSSSTRSLVQDKVSITSCHVGDLVLLCLDERLDQYVVFTVGTTLHFLHTECLTPLGLKSESGEARKQWLIAEVVDKEYCQAKKSNNRFKVPVGTKFYRVKAKKWTREVNPSPSKKADTASGTL